MGPLSPLWQQVRDAASCCSNIHSPAAVHYIVMLVGSQLPACGPSVAPPMPRILQTRSTAQQGKLSAQSDVASQHQTVWVALGRGPNSSREKGHDRGWGHAGHGADAT